MKIAFLIDGFGIGGTELNATRTLESLARRGLVIDVVHLHQDGPLRSRIERAGHRLHHMPVVSFASPRIVLRVMALASTLRKIDATVIHTQDVYTNILGVAAGRVLQRRPVLTSRRWKDDVPRRELTPLNAWAHRTSTLVLPNSRALVPSLRAEGVREEKIEVHQNFIDDSALNLLTDDARRAWRASIGVRPGALVVGCVARLSGVKRHDLLLAAFAEARSAAPDTQLVLVGDGDRRAPLAEQARALGIADDVIFTGTLPNQPLSQQLFDIAALTSDNEGFPNALVEASACGVPLAATRVGGVPDVLIEGRTGLGAAAGDVPGFAAALRTLLTDERRRNAFGDAARAEVIARFSETAAIDRLLALYKRVSA